jgi:hypothetical protein
VPGGVGGNIVVGVGNVDLLQLMDAKMMKDKITFTE